MAGNAFTGYCSSCMKNIPHVCLIQNPWIRFFDSLTFNFARIFRLGAWHCIQCGQTSFHLKTVRREAPTFQLPDQSPETEATPVGNFLKSERSLTLRSQRTHRFSLKFRDSIVLRLLSGSSTMSQLGRELNVSEVDLVDWLADYVCRKDEKIRELESIINRSPPLQNLLAQNESISYSSEDAIDVQVNPKHT